MKRWSTVQDFIANGKAPADEDVAAFEGFASKGDGGASFWVKTGLVGVPSQSPIDLNAAVLTDTQGVYWRPTTGAIFYFDGTNQWFPAPFGDKGNGLYQFNGVGWNYYEQAGGAVPIAVTAGLITNSFNYDVGTALSFSGYSSPGDGGGAQWIKTSGTGSQSQSPALRGDGTLTDATGAVWRIVVTGLLNPTALGFTGGGDEFATLSAALASSRSVIIPSDCMISGTLSINCTDEPFEIDLNGNTITSSNAGIFSAFGGLLYEQSVSSHTANTITISASNDLITYLSANIDDRPVIKIVSDDVIDINESANERCGEFARVVSVSSGVITLETDLYFTYTTAPRVAALVSQKFTLKNGKLDVSSLATVRGAHVFCTKLYQPVLEDIEILKGNDAGIVLRSCYEPKVIRPSIHNLTDDASGGFFGYGIDDNSSHATLVTDGDFSNTRHAYTTNTGESVAGGDMSAFGATMYSKVKDCTCTGNSDDAFDTHPNAYFITFENVKGYRNSKGLIKDRAKFTTVKSPESYGDGFGVRTTGNCDNLKVINPVIENSTSPLFFDNITKGSVTIDGGVISLTDGNELCRLTNINLKGSVNFKYSGSTNFSKMFRLSSSAVNLESFFADTSESTATSFRLFEIASGGDNEIRVGNMRVKSLGSPSSLNMVSDATGAGTNKAIIDDLLLDAFYPLSGNTLTSDSYSITRWSQGDSSTLFASISAGGQAIPELAYNGSPKISLIATVPNSTVTLAALPDAIFTGQVITVTLSKNSNSFLTIAHGASGNTDLISAADVTLGKGESMSLFWNGSAWEEFLQTN